MTKDARSQAKAEELAEFGDVASFLVLRIRVQDDVVGYFVFDNMTDEDLSDIAAFYDAQPRSGGTADPDKVDLGRKVYLAGIAERQVPACSGCHSPTGNGNGPAGYPGLAGQHADYIASQLKMFRKGYEDPAGRTNGGEAKIMRTTAFRMSDMEIEAVASYIAGLQPNS